MKPVEIEFLMKDNLTAGLDKSKLTVGQLLDIAKKAAAELKNRIGEQNRSIDSTNQKLQVLEKRLQGMKPGDAQRRLSEDVNICRQALEKERAELARLEQQHSQAEKNVSNLEQVFRRTSVSAVDLKQKIAEQSAVVRQIEADVAAAEKAFKEASPGKDWFLKEAELSAAKKTLEEEKSALADLKNKQEACQGSTQKLSRELREMQDTLARMRVAGLEDSEMYKELSQKAAVLSDTLSDLNQQTRILAHDDANLQGFISGINGLSGAFTAATGTMSLFASENENLAKIQTRVQSVMAITMGLQQVYNTLNKDSAFRLVTVANAKKLLTAANYQLATSLGISNAAATALMATLTLGLSAVITAVVVAFERLSAAQEEAAQEAKKLAEVEADGRAQMIKTRFEIDNTLKKLKEVKGNKAEERKAIEECNRKYGEAFGYYQTVDQWYDKLIEKAETYIQILFLQAKAQALVNSAIEADKRVGELEAATPGTADTSLPWWGQAYFYTSPAAWILTRGRLPAVIDKINKTNYDNAIKDAKDARDAALREASNIMGGLERLREQSGIGGHVKPGSSPAPTSTSSQPKGELQQLHQQNLQAEIDLIDDGSEKKRRQLQLNYEKEKAELDELEKKWRDVQKGYLTKDQEEVLNAARSLTESKKTAGESAIAEEEKTEQQKKLEAARKAWQDYLIEYGDFEEKRKALTEQYSDLINAAETDGEKATLQKQLQQKLQELNFDEFKTGINFADVFSNIDAQSTESLSKLRNQLKEYINRAAKDLKPEDLKALQEAFDKLDLKVKERSPFTSLINDFDGLRTSQKAVEEAQKQLNAVMDGGVIYIEEYDEQTGEATSKLLTQEEAERRLAKAQSDRYKKLAEMTQSLHESVSKAREYGEIASSITDMLSGLGIEVSSEVGDIINGYGEMLDGLESIDLTRPASIITGTIKTLSGLGKTMAGFLSLGGIDFGGQKSIQKYEEAKARYEGYMSVLDKVIAKQKELVSSMNSADYLNASNSYEYAKSLVQKQEEAARNLGRQYLNSGASGGFLGIGSHSSRGVDQREGLSHEAWMEYSRLTSRSDDLKRLGLTVDALEQAREGRMTGLFDLSAKQLEWIMLNAPQFWAELHEDTRTYLEQIIACADAWEDIENERRENLTKISFDDFYSSWLEKVKDMKSDVKDIADQMEEDFQNAILTGMMDEKYKEKLRELYERWASMMEGDGLSDAEIEALRAEYNAIATEAINERNAWARTFGWETGDNATTQTGKTGGFSAMSQDQGNKLDGMFTSGLMHWSSIDEKMDEVTTQMGDAESHLKNIEENTRKSNGLLGEIKEFIQGIVRDGVKMK